MTSVRFRGGSRHDQKPDPCMSANWTARGLGGVTAPCAFVSPMGAFIWRRSPEAGLHELLLLRQDPVADLSVHSIQCACGAWGRARCPGGSQWNLGQRIQRRWDHARSKRRNKNCRSFVTGIFYGGGVKQLISQAIEVAV